MNEIPNLRVETPILDGTIIILFRGSPFRTRHENLQFSAARSWIKHIFEPIHRKFPKNKIKVIFSIHEHDLNSDLVKIISGAGYETQLLEHTVAKDKGRKGQSESYVHSLRDVKEENEFVFITRPDLVFFRDVDFSRADKGRFLFQWNLFQSIKRFNAREVADQYQFVGGDLFFKYQEILNNPKRNMLKRLRGPFPPPGCLHNLFEFIAEEFGEDKISYLNYVENPNPQDDWCWVRGGAKNRDQWDHIYKYIREKMTKEDIERLV